MINIVTTEGIFEDETIEGCMHRIAKYTVDDANGDHMSAPSLKEIRVLVDGDEFYLEVPDSLQDKMDKMCDEAQFEYDDSCANRDEPFTYM